MKKNSTPPTLEELLASFEHAGRDARRQQQLSEMIERMAAEETAQRRRAVRLWSVRLVTAACLVLFMMTLVRLWYPSQPSVGPQMAQAPKMQGHTSIQTTPSISNQPAHVGANSRPTDLPLPSSICEPKPALPSQPVEADPILEELVPAPIFDEPISSEQYAEADDATSPEDEQQFPVAPFQPEVSDAVAQAEPAPEPEAPAQRRSLFSFRQAEPSMMDGNVLSFRII